MRCAGYHDLAGAPEGERAHGIQGAPACQCGHHLLALAAHDHVAAELRERCAGRRRAVRADRHGAAAAPAERGQEPARQAQLRLGAAPEQIGGGRGQHGHVRRVRRDALDQPGIVLAHQRAVEQQTLVPFGLEQRPAVAEFERQMRLAAAEVDAVLERPGGIDQRDLHDTAIFRGRVSARSPPSQAARSARPLSQPSGSGRSSAARSARVSATK